MFPPPHPNKKHAIPEQYKHRGFQQSLTKHAQTWFVSIGFSRAETPILVHWLPYSSGVHAPWFVSSSFSVLGDHVVRRLMLSELTAEAIPMICETSVSKVQTCSNGHVLQALAASLDDGWRCDAGICESGITDFYQTHGMHRFRCDACDSQGFALPADAQYIKSINGYSIE